MRDSGFTLIELLVAFAILAMTLTAITGAHSAGLSLERAADRDISRLLEARSILDRLGADLALSEGSQEGQLRTGERWTLSIAALDAAEEGLNPFTAFDVRLAIHDGDSPVLTLHSFEIGERDAVR